MKTKKVSDFFQKGTIIPIALVASAILGFMAVMSFLTLPTEQSPLADMRIEPINKSVEIGDTFTVDVVVQATVPVNVFAGDLLFNNKILEVESIDYNTSIADLWAKEPWYSNGAGTLNFIGGTTKPEGFTGTDKLLSITFKALAQGDGTLTIDHAQILQHDGLGTEVTLAQPIDALFAVQNATRTPPQQNNLLHSSVPKSLYTVVTQPPSADLNGDGAVNLTDASIMLLHLGSSDMRYDLTMDGKVDLADMAVILNGH